MTEHLWWLDEWMCSGLDKLETFIKHPLGQTTAHLRRACSRTDSGTFAEIPAYICSSICPASPLWFGSTIVPSAHKSQC